MLFIIIIIIIKGCVSVLRPSRDTLTSLSSLVLDKLPNVSVSSQFRPERSTVHPCLKDSINSPGRPRHTWLRTLNADLHPLNHGLNSAWRLAQDRVRWRQLVETATLYSLGLARDDDDGDDDNQIMMMMINSRVVSPT